MFGDHKNMITITFQTIVLDEPAQYDITYNLLIVFNILGLAAYYWLRRSRMQENLRQYEDLKREKSFAESTDYSDFVADTVRQINEVMQRRHSLFNATHVRSTWIPEMDLNLPVTEDEEELTTASSSARPGDNFEETLSTGVGFTNESEEWVWDAHGLNREEVKHVMMNACMLDNDIA